MTTFTHNCEGAAAPGTNWTDTNQGASGDPFTITRTGGTIQTTTTAGEVIFGTRSVKITPGAPGITNRLAWLLPNVGQARARGYFRLATTPPVGADANLVTIMGNGGACAAAQVRSNGKVALTNAAAGTTPPGAASIATLTLPAVYGFDLICDPGTSTADGTARMVVYNADGTTFFDTGTITSDFFRTGVVTEVRFGLTVDFTMIADAMIGGDTYQLVGPYANGVVASGAFGWAGAAVGSRGQTLSVTITDTLGLSDDDAQQAQAVDIAITDLMGMTDQVIAVKTLSGTGAQPLNVTAALTAGGAVSGPPGAAPLAVTATLTAAGTLGNANSARLNVTATLTADGRVAYQKGAAPLVVTAALTARGAVTVNASTERLTNRWYAMLPAMFRQADDLDTSTSTGRPLWRFMDAILSPLAVPEHIAERVMGGDLTNPTLADDQWIPWLAQAVGVAGVGVPQQRNRLLALAAAPELGSNAYMVALITPMLSGTKTVDVVATPPWTITVRVLSSELGSVGGTPEGLRDALYATGRVPAGYLIEVTTTGQTWAEIDAALPTWAPAEGKPWGDVDAIGL